MGKYHENNAVIYRDLAVAYESQGKYKSAEESYKKSFLIKEKILGENHIYTALSCGDLAEMYRAQGECQEAELN